MFPYLERLPIYWKTSHAWEVFPYVGSLPMYMRRLTTYWYHKWEDFPYNIWDDFPCAGRLPTFEKSSHMWEVFPFMRRLPKHTGPIHGKTSHIIYVTTSHVREDFPDLRSLLTCGKSSQTDEPKTC
jgi:hypothetical protein